MCVTWNSKNNLAELPDDVWFHLHWYLEYFCFCEHMSGQRKLKPGTVPGSMRPIRCRLFHFHAPVTLEEFSPRPEQITHKNKLWTLFTQRFFYQRRIKHAIVIPVFVGVSPWIHHYYPEPESSCCLSNLQNTIDSEFYQSSGSRSSLPIFLLRTGSATWNPFSVS